MSLMVACHIKVEISCRGVRYFGVLKRATLIEEKFFTGTSAGSLKYSSVGLVPSKPTRYWEGLKSALV